VFLVSKSPGIGSIVFIGGIILQLESHLEDGKEVCGAVHPARTSFSVSCSCHNAFWTF